MIGKRTASYERAGSRSAGFESWLEVRLQHDAARVQGATCIPHAYHMLQRVRRKVLIPQLWATSGFSHVMITR